MKLVSGDVHFSLSSYEPPTLEQNIYRKVVTKRDFRLLMSRSCGLKKEWGIVRRYLILRSMFRT
ncbi:hypothetical protein THOG11_10189 [Vibrio harveyi]|nr:hypothetical protein TH15OA1_190013 [Vibrio harveyi]CAH1547619.1 hypothetical protein THOD03_10191 [Vibrio harveyi]CAH1549133.1 hypothetical protein THOG11_10189 [Vibrio harveyi]